MDVDAVSLAESLLEEATQTNERRALVLAGEREQGYRTLESVLDALPVGITETTLVGPEDRLRCEHVQQVNASQLLGTTRTIATLDASDDLQPNALGKVVGAVDGGGLLILLTPPLEEWPDRQGAFAESLAVPPFALSDVTGRFQRRLAETLRAHRASESSISRLTRSSMTVTRIPRRASTDRPRTGSRAPPATARGIPARILRGLSHGRSG